MIRTSFIIDELRQIGNICEQMAEDIDEHEKLRKGPEPTVEADLGPARVRVIPAPQPYPGAKENWGFLNRKWQNLYDNVVGHPTGLE